MLEKTVRVDGGYISLAVDERLTVLMVVKAGPTLVQLTLTQEAAGLVADALDDMSDYLAGQCATCGANGGTLGCTCDPTPLQWAVLRHDLVQDEPPHLLYFCGSQHEAEQHAAARLESERYKASAMAYTYFAAQVAGGMEPDRRDVYEVWEVRPEAERLVTAWDRAQQALESLGTLQQHAAPGVGYVMRISQQPATVR